MKLLVDRCAGKRLADWLRGHGHDVLEARALDPDPGDRALLEMAGNQDRVLVTIDTDFGELIYVDRIAHCGIVRLPDIPAGMRIKLMDKILVEYNSELRSRAIITVRGERIRISKWED
jgi:predicted nuclease of predicted toxin-antitoxin system